MVEFFLAKDEDTIRVFMCATIAVRCHADDDDMGNDIRYLMVNESSPFFFPTMNRNNLFSLYRRRIVRRQNYVWYSTVMRVVWISDFPPFNINRSE